MFKFQKNHRLVFSLSTFMFLLLGVTHLPAEEESDLIVRGGHHGGGHHGGGHHGGGHHGGGHHGGGHHGGHHGGRHHRGGYHGYDGGYYGGYGIGVDVYGQPRYDYYNPNVYYQESSTKEVPVEQVPVNYYYTQPAIENVENGSSGQVLEENIQNTKN